jgi:fructose-bisphosphate aldolase class II
MVPTLRQTIQNARSKGCAVGHFNISNLESFHAIYNAAKKLGVPVIIGVSEGERDFVGVQEAEALVKTVRERDQFPIYLNADHTYSFDRVKEAVDAGYDAVIIDGAKLSLDENIAMAKQCVEYVHSYIALNGRDVLVEGELGYIGTSSKILDKIPDGVGLDPVHLTQPEDSKKFLEATGLDMLAPSVGNVHGLIIGGNPKLNIDRIREIATAVSKPLVLHGASGIKQEELKAAVEAGIAIVHYNTELRVAFRDAMKKSLADNPDEVAPYKIAAPAVAAVQMVVEEKLKVMNKL